MNLFVPRPFYHSNNVMILTISVTLVGANHLQRTHSMHSELPICLRLNRKPSLQRSSQCHRSSNYKPIIIMPPVTLYWLQIANITHSVGAGWFNDFWMSVRPGWVSSRKIHMGPGKNVYSGQESLGFFSINGKSFNLILAKMYVHETCHSWLSGIFTEKTPKITARCKPNFFEGCLDAW